MHCDFDGVEDNDDGKDSDTAHPQIAVVPIAINGTSVNDKKYQKSRNYSQNNSLYNPESTYLKVKDLVIFANIVKLRELPS